MISSPNDLTGKLAIDANGLNNLKLAAKEQSPEAIKQVATQFESVFVNMMLKSMREALPQDDTFDSEQTRTYTSMLDQQLSQTIASKGIGLADVLAKQLSKTGYGTPIQQDNDTSGQIPTNASPAANVTAPPTATTFKNKLSDAAEEASQQTGIPANFILGQAGLESGWGKHEIKDSSGQSSHNLFGIKATANWKGKVIEAKTTEYVHGEKQTKVEKFRAYDSYADAFKDFGNLMANNPRYSNVLNHLNNATHYAQAIQNAGYATDPEYAVKLSQAIRKVSTT
jgi:flagellar protein FlgJ